MDIKIKGFADGLPLPGGQGTRVIVAGKPTLLPLLKSNSFYSYYNQRRIVLRFAFFCFAFFILVLQLFLKMFGSLRNYFYICSREDARLLTLYRSYVTRNNIQNTNLI